MRILLPINSVFVAGGIGTVVSGLLPALRAAAGPGEEVVVASPADGNGALARALPQIGRPAAAAARLVYEQIVLPRRAATCDTIHLCDARPILASRRPFVLTVHDVSYLDHPGWYAPGAARYKRLMLAAALAKRPAAILCDSRHTRERLLAHHPWAVELDTQIVHPGLVAPPPDRPRRRVDTAEPYFVTVSTIETRKNHVGLLRAFRMARARGLRLRWKIAGAAGHGSEQILAALTAAEGVDVLGWVSPAALEQLYAGALFLALPSHEEGFGYPALEAMSRGVATVCSTGSALDETVGVAGLRVPPEDTQAWAAALRCLQDDHTERERLVGAGGENARRFAWTAAADRILQIHRSLSCDSI